MEYANPCQNCEKLNSLKEINHIFRQLLKDQQRELNELAAELNERRITMESVGNEWD